MIFNTEKSENVERPIPFEDLLKSPAKVIWVVEAGVDKRLGQWAFIIHNKKKNNGKDSVKIKCLSPDSEPIEYSSEEYGKKILAYKRPPFFIND